jgi:hypothetical protein
MVGNQLVNPQSDRYDDQQGYEGQQVVVPEELLEFSVVHNQLVLRHGVKCGNNPGGEADDDHDNHCCLRPRLDLIEEFDVFHKWLSRGHLTAIAMMNPKMTKAGMRLKARLM